MGRIPDKVQEILSDLSHPFYKPYETPEECEVRVNAFWEGVHKLQMDLGIHDVVCAFGVACSDPNKKGCSSFYYAGNTGRVASLLRNLSFEFLTHAATIVPKEEQK